MPTWLRSVINAFLGKVPGKTGRLGTATRMMIDADFSLRRESPRETQSPNVRILFSNGSRRMLFLSFDALGMPVFSPRSAGA
jgi:hypothetical protein